MKVLMLSDIHFGLNIDNPLFYKINLDLFGWLADLCKAEQIHEVFILGDVFHNRKNVNLLTLNNCYECLNKLNFCDIHILTGNHDCYYSENSEFHSLDFLKGWSNISIYDQITYKNFYGKEVGIVPWSGKYFDKKLNPCDLILGHFELVGFEYGSATVRDGTNTAIFEDIPLILSGHFHKYQDQSRKGQRIVYLGSPYQHNWGELDEKYVHILDFSNMKLKKIKNTISPKHVKISKLDDLKKLDSQQFVKIILNDEEKEELEEKVLLKSPLELTIERNFNKKVEATIKEFKNVDLNKNIDEFIESMIVDDELRVKIADRNKKILQELGL